MDISRRDLGLSALAGVATSALATGTMAAPPSAGARTFVLVHGAWHGGWCWRSVSDRLAATGARVFAPTLTGLGERSHLLSAGIDLDTHIADVANVIRWERLEDIVLVGHSYGGMVVAGVADALPSRIGGIVYLEGFHPRNGQSVDELAPRKGAVSATAAISIPPVPSAVFGVSPVDQRWVDALCTPQPTATFAQRIKLTGAYDTIGRKTFIRTASRMAWFESLDGELKNDPAWRTATLSCGHDAMIADPAGVTELLLKA